MKLFAKILLALAVVLFLAAIWLPAQWWQLGLSGLLVMFVAAGILGGKARR